MLYVYMIKLHMGKDYDGWWTQILNLAVKSFIIFFLTSDPNYWLLWRWKASCHGVENDPPENSGTFLDKGFQDHLHRHNNFSRQKSMDAGKVTVLLFKAIELLT